MMKRGIVTMYKKQMTVQKVICLLSVIASVVLFVYSLGLMTDVYGDLKYPLNDSRIEQARKELRPEVEKGTDFIGIGIYEELDAFNKDLLMVAIGMILVSLLLFITNTASRRKYYIGNYFAVGVNVAACVAASAWTHVMVRGFCDKYLAMDHEAIGWIYTEKLKSAYSQSTFWFDAHYVVCALMLLVSVLLILNVIWKVRLMNEEKQLIEEGKAVLA